MILAGIDTQIAHAQAGEPSGLFFKTNSITDKDVIEKLVEASQAGVPVTLFVRGISCIVPGLEGLTENVRVVSIVGRLLEHSRIYGFGPRETMKLYLSSADLMTRNMDKRIEIAWPVLSDDLREQVLGYLDTCMADTAKLRELRSDRRYTPLGFFAKEDEQGQTVLFDSQQYLIEEAQRRHLAAAEKEAARDANRRRTAGAGADAAGMPPVEASPTEAVGEEVAELVELIEQAATQASAHEQEESVQLGAGGVSAARPGAEDASERQPEAVVAPEPQPEAVAGPKPRAAVEPTAATRPAAGAAPTPAEASESTNILVSELPAKRGGKPSLLVRVLARILRF